MFKVGAHYGYSKTRRHPSVSKFIYATKNKGDMKKGETDTLIEKMFRVGAHYGYSKTRRHPSLSSYIYATKNKMDIIDLEKTGIALEHALEFVKKLGAEGKTILLVGTKPEAKEITKNLASRIMMVLLNGGRGQIGLKSCLNQNKTTLTPHK